MKPRFFACALLVVFVIPVFKVSAVTGAWITDANDFYWDNALNWSSFPDYPGSAGDAANFLDLTTDPLSVNLSSGANDITVGSIPFSATNAYIINSGGFSTNKLIINNPFGNTRILLNSTTTPTINSPIQFDPPDNIAFIQGFAPSASLNINNDVSLAAGNTLILLDVNGGVNFSAPMSASGSIVSDNSKIFF